MPATDQGVDCSQFSREVKWGRMSPKWQHSQSGPPLNIRHPRWVLPRGDQGVGLRGDWAAAQPIALLFSLCS